MPIQDVNPTCHFEFIPDGNPLEGNARLSCGGVTPLVRKLNLASERNCAHFVELAQKTFPNLDVESLEEEIKRFANDGFEKLKQSQTPSAEATPKWEPSTEAKRAAEELLKNNNLLATVVDTVNELGVVNERPIVCLAYLVATSRLLPKPLCLSVRGDPSSGKSHVIRTLLDILPPDSFVDVTDMTGNALYYLGEIDVRHKLLVLGERKRQLSPESVDTTKALRELIEDGRVSKLLPVKNADGSFSTQKLEVEGPVAIIESCSHDYIALEDQTRQIEAWTDDSPEQTKRVLHFFAERAAGKFPLPDEKTIETIRALQTLLEPAPVIIPFAEDIAERFPSRVVESRRAFVRLLALIEASAILHQRQRDKENGAIRADWDDFKVAYAVLRPWLRARVAGGYPPNVIAVWEAIKERTDSFCAVDVAKQIGKPRNTISRALRTLAEAQAIKPVNPALGPQDARKKFYQINNRDWTPEDINLLESVDQWNKLGDTDVSGEY